MLTFSDLLRNFADLDGDQDGLLLQHEFSQSFHDDGKVFHLLDIDQNGELTKEELSKTLDHLQQFGEVNGGIDKAWFNEQQMKPGNTDLENDLEDGDSTSKDDSSK